jgi:diadenosine tetraphosphate (Ap4A) HIT family hydrolase
VADHQDCPLCRDLGGAVLFDDGRLRVVRVLPADDIDAARFPGFCRVIWNAHVKEMTDLAHGDRVHLMDVVFRVEAALRDTLNPVKINLASLGNMTPHVHWHVIPRYAADPAYPKPIWAVPAVPQLGTLQRDMSQENDMLAWSRAVTAALQR